MKKCQKGIAVLLATLLFLLPGCGGESSSANSGTEGGGSTTTSEGEASQQSSGAGNHYLGCASLSRPHRRENYASNQ